MKLFSSSLFVVILVLAASVSAVAQTEVTLIAPGSAREAIEQIIAGFEGKTGYKVKTTFASGGVVKQQVAKGGAFDVPIMQMPLDEVINSGNVIVSSRTPLASGAVGVAVKKGAPKPDISTPEATKQSLLAAKSITYPDPAVGGLAAISIAQMLEKLGITEQMKAKTKFAPSGPVGIEMTAKGEIELGFTFVSEMGNPGVDIVGELPAEICPPTFLYGFISSHAKDPAAARALLDYLSSPAASEAYKEAKMHPARQSER